MSALLSQIKTLEKMPDGPALHDALTKFHRDIPGSLMKGRNVVGGSARAWGLQFGGLEKALDHDPLYQSSFQCVEKETLLRGLHLKNIFMILKYGISDRSGDIIEFGSYRCGTAVFIAKVAQALGYTGTIYALDTFEGIPDANAEIDFHCRGDFEKNSFEILRDRICELGLSNLVLVKGLFEETLPKLLPTMNKVVLAHIDCDVEASTRYAISAIEKQMADGGYMIIDDVPMPACLGVLQAVEETLQKRGFHAEQAFPHFVYRMPKIF
ncbi:MAG: macrocin O-methyltransferase [Verrucomicrobia bacterium]|nr:macrocin O-methyltransferase [Verrucomicrobiota bacterium]